MRRRYLTILAALLPFAAVAEPARPLVVVELFTSQGCSSCPPADAVLLELSRTRADVLPLAFHVTYWDRLGWRDPFSLEAATVRQRAYGRSMGLETIYTPQAVVAGHVDVVGSDRGALLAAIARAAAAPPVTLTVLREAGSARVEGSGPAAGATVWLVGYDALHRTAVGRGENGGRTLLEANVVRSVQSLGAWSGEGVRLERPVPAGERLAVLVQAADGRIVAAARE